MKNIDWSKLAVYAKAVRAFLVGLGTVIAVFVSVASDGVMSGADWGAVLSAIVGTLVGTGAVAKTTNKVE